MGIMALMVGVAVVQYTNMTRGSAMKSALSHVRSALQLARQQAVMNGKKTYFIIESNTFTVCIQEGVGTDAVGSDQIGDRYADWANKIVVGGTVYNLDTGKSGSVTNISMMDPSVGGYSLKTVEDIWTTYARYGWPVYKKMYLPRNFSFTNNTDKLIIFNGDGTSGVGGYKINIAEGINPDYPRTIEVKPTGLIELEKNS
jgi:hypothetical protein